MILVNHRGEKSGKAYTSPLVYTRDGDNYVIIASKGGAPEDPKRDPQPRGQPGHHDRGRHGDVSRCVPRVAEGDERGGGTVPRPTPCRTSPSTPRRPPG